MIKSSATLVYCLNVFLGTTSLAFANNSNQTEIPQWNSTPQKPLQTKKPVDAAVEIQNNQVSTTNLPDYAVIRNLCNAGNYQVGIDKALGLLVKTPQDGDVRIALAQCYLKQNQIPLAREQLTKALTDIPTNNDARLVLINLELSEHNTDRAMELVNQGLSLDPQDPDLLKARDNVTYAKNPSKMPATVSAETPATSYLTFRELYQSGKKQEAIDSAVKYLETNPNDGDVRLVLAQFYLQENKRILAREQLTKALADTPTNYEVRNVLINLDLEERHYTDAKSIVDEGLHLDPENKTLLKAKTNVSYAMEHGTFVAVSKAPIKAGPSMYDQVQKLFSSGKKQEAIAKAKQYLLSNPNDGDVRYALGQFYMDQKQYDLAYEQFSRGLQQYPEYVEIRIALTNLFIQQNQLDSALMTTSKGLELQPNNVNLLSQQGTVYFEKGRFPQAAEYDKRALQLDPGNENARNLKTNLDWISNRYLIGRNTVGISGQGLNASDQHQIWQYGQAYYEYDTNYGPIFGKLNYNKRFDIRAYQGEIEAYPILNKYVYFDVDLAFANQPVIFPDYVAGIEAYVSLQNVIDVSFGGKYNSITTGKAYTVYTGSLYKQIGSNAYTFRPYYFAPNPGSGSTLYTASYRHYFQEDSDFFINLTAIYGNSPDLYDLEQANFVVVRNKGVAVDFSFPILSHTMVIDIGASYSNQVYPDNALVRNLAGGNLSIIKRF